MTSSSDGRKCGAFTKKPLVKTGEDGSAGHLALERTLTLYDLIVVGVAGTIGSGVFALVGLITVKYAGAAGTLSWLLAGLGCTLSGLSYTELGATFKGEGGAYGYSYAALGEIYAVIAAYCLTMEFGISGSAVARNWGDKIVVWLLAVDEELPTEGAPWYEAYIGMMRRDYSANIMAALLQLGVCLLLWKGMTVGKGVLNFFTVLKMLLIVVMIAAGLYLFNPANLTPFAPYGAAGVLRGSTAAFFGYLGFDEVAVLSAEAKRPLRDIPLSLCVCLVAITGIHVVAAVAIAGLVPFDTVDPDSAFLVAFVDRGYWAIGHIVAIGELVSLPLVVLVSFLAQPRILHAMAVDGLLPKLFAESSLSKSTLISGVVCAVVAAIAPFEVLDDMVSAAVLLAFNLTNSSLIAFKRGALLKSSPSLSSSPCPMCARPAVTYSPMAPSSLLPGRSPTPSCTPVPPTPPPPSSSSSLLQRNDGQPGVDNSSKHSCCITSNSNSSSSSSSRGRGRSNISNSGHRNSSSASNSGHGGGGDVKVLTPRRRLRADAVYRPPCRCQDSNNNSVASDDGASGSRIANGPLARLLLHVLPASPARRCSVLVLLLNLFSVLAGACLHVSFSWPDTSFIVPTTTTSSGSYLDPVTSSVSLSQVAYVLSMVCWGCAAVSCGCIAYLCPEVSLHDVDASGIEAFEVPFGPLVPSLGIAVNCLLLCLLSGKSLMYSLVALCAVCAFYVLYGAKGSRWSQEARAGSVRTSAGAQGREEAARPEHLLPDMESASSPLLLSSSSPSSSSSSSSPSLAVALSKLGPSPKPPSYSSCG